jgi:LCP family protein required for cell wall assembly
MAKSHSSRHQKGDSLSEKPTSTQSGQSYSRRKKVKQKHYVRNGLIAVLIIATVVVGYHAFKIIQFYNKIQIQADTTEKPEEPQEEEQKVYNILLMGYGGEGHSGAYLTDTLMVANVDMEKKNVKLVSIPRDMWVQVPTKSGTEYFSKINAIYQMGLYKDQYPDVDVKSDSEGAAAQLLKRVIARITGLEIDYFVAIDFQGFIKAVDTLGGIEVDVERTFDDYLYPVTGKEDDLCGRVPKPTLTDDEMRQWLEDYNNKSPEEKEAFDNRPMAEWTEEEFQKVATESPQLAYPCRYEHIHYDAGKQEMDGESALKFARSRKALQDGGDFNRAARQQRVIQAVRDKVLNVGFLPKILPLLEDLDDHIRMDIPFDASQTFMGEGQNAASYDIDTTVLSDDNYLQISTSSDGQSILIPQEGIDEWDDVQTYVFNYVNEITPTPTPDPTMEASKEAELEENTEQDKGE